MTTKTHSGRSVSVWMATAELPARLALTKNARAGVCVIGAEIAGMTTVYSLAREDKSVIVLDDGLIAGGETCRTTAQLVNALDQRPNLMALTPAEFESLITNLFERMGLETRLTSL